MKCKENFMFKLVMMLTPKTGADTYVEIGFTSASGTSSPSVRILRPYRFFTS
ncbi:hypothetical protein [Paenibacillus sp. FSL H8-0537]|uniref:hypothetical protein n=1 Tax=Paenibacillus sp. FSL H8-0537 TaxID=2921399 RepID=UPI0031013E6A